MAQTRTALSARSGTNVGETTSWSRVFKLFELALSQDGNQRRPSQDDPLYCQDGSSRASVRSVLCRQSILPDIIKRHLAASEKLLFGNSLSGPTLKSHHERGVEDEVISLGLNGGG